MSTPAAPAAPAPAAPRALKTPDLTPAQIVAVVGGIVALAVSLGVPLSGEKQHQIVLFAVVFAPVLVAVDASIRHSRAKYLHTALLQTMGVLTAVQPPATAAQGNGDQPAAAVPVPGETQLPPYIK